MRPLQPISAPRRALAACLLALAASPPAAAPAQAFLCRCGESAAAPARHRQPEALPEAGRHAAQTPRLSRRRRYNTDDPWKSVPFNPDEFWDWLQQNAP